MGPSGVAGEQGPDYPNGIILVKHSQSTRVPDCPSNMLKLWSGYSLLFIEGNEMAHNQDLGNSHCILRTIAKAHAIFYLRICGFLCKTIQHNAFLVL